MARVTLSALVNDISGKLNGSVFQRTQGGLCIRNQAGKLSSNTSRSNQHKIYMSTVQGDWQNLSDANRQLWNTHALYLNKKQKHSTSLIINGHQLFIQVNCIRQDLSFYVPLFDPPLLSTPVLAPLPLPISITSVERDGLSLKINLSRSVDETKEVIILYMSRPLGATQVTGNTKMLLMRAATVSGTVFECNAEYYNTYGRTIDVGEFCQTKIALYSTDSENFSSYSVGRFEVQ